MSISGSASRRYLRKAGGWLVSLLLAVLALVTVATATGWFAITPVLSGSMRPDFNPGDAMITRRVPVSSLHVGDIVNVKLSSKEGGGHRVHRIISLRHQGSSVVVHTKGDANSATDLHGIVLTGHQYKTVGRLPYVGWLVDFRAAYGELILLAAITILGAISLLQHVRSRRAQVISADHAVSAGA